MHLDAQEVPEPVREEDPAETALDGLLRRQMDDVLVLEDAREREVRLVVEFRPGRPARTSSQSACWAPSIATIRERNRSSAEEAA